MATSIHALHHQPAITISKHAAGASSMAQHSVLSASLKPMIMCGNLLGVFPVQFEGPLIKKRISWLPRLLHFISGIVLIAICIVHVVYQVLQFRSRPKECLSMRFDALSLFIGEVSYTCLMLTVVYTGHLLRAPLEKLAEQFWLLEQEVRLLGRMDHCTRRLQMLFWLLPALSIGIIFSETLSAAVGSSYSQLKMNIIENTNRDHGRIFVAAMNYGPFAWLWSVAFAYIIAIYVPVIWLFETVASILRSHRDKGENTPFIRQLQDIHERTSGVLLLANAHTSTLVLVFFFEEVLYGILQLHRMLYVASPAGDSVFRTVCVFIRLATISGVLIKVYFSARAPARDIYKMLVKHPSSHELQAWQGYLQSEHLGAKFGFMQVTPNFFLNIINSAITFAVLLIQFQDPKSIQPECK